ncbi:MAG: DHH family phosphoesterase [Nitrospinae bacterium]|nr:DHH family phosphoesterase [Nitrospinota bacterium]
MRYIAFIDGPEWIKLIETITKGAEELYVFNLGQPFIPPKSLVRTHYLHLERFSAAEIERHGLDEGDRILVSLTEKQLLNRVLEFLCGQKPAPSIVVIAEEDGESVPPVPERPNVSYLDIQEMARFRINREWRKIDIARRARELHDMLDGAGKIAILTQNDPDPDAIACGLALQAMLGRNRITAPIVTFGSVTRNENITMIKLLKTVVRTITPETLAEFDRVVLVDVQPPYFGPMLNKEVDAVIDHHPYRQEFETGFKEINTAYGATSTLMFEYLTAYGSKINKRLATALLYGIMTDTMRLERGAQRRDFDAFTALWPMADKDMLSSMGKPRLNSEELSYFVRAIRNRKLMGEFLFLWLGVIRKADIIPRLADFSLQIGETSFTATAGVFGREIIISIRSQDPELDAGKLAKRVFGKWGNAGGHPTMAKAVISLPAFKSAFGMDSTKELSAKIVELLEKKL